MDCPICKVPLVMADKHSDEHGSQGYDQYGRKKKKGLLGDLFDF